MWVYWISRRIRCSAYRRKTGARKFIIGSGGSQDLIKAQKTLIDQNWGSDWVKARNPGQHAEITVLDHFETEFKFTDDAWELESIVLSDVRKEPGFCADCHKRTGELGGSFIEYEGTELIAIFPE